MQLGLEAGHTALLCVWQGTRVLQQGLGFSKKIQMIFQPAAAWEFRSRLDFTLVRRHERILVPLKQSSWTHAHNASVDRRDVVPSGGQRADETHGFFRIPGDA